MTAPVLSTPGVLRNFTRPDFPAYWGGGDGPVKGAVVPGDEFFNEPTITSASGTNARKLKGLGYFPADNTDGAWAIDDFFLVNDFGFHWDWDLQDFTPTSQ